MYPSRVLSRDSQRLSHTSKRVIHHHAHLEGQGSLPGDGHSSTLLPALRVRYSSCVLLRQTVPAKPERQQQPLALHTHVIEVILKLKRARTALFLWAL